MGFAHFHPQARVPSIDFFPMPASNAISPIGNSDDGVAGVGNSEISDPVRRDFQSGD